MANFHDIEFRFSDAETERAYAPSVLTTAFVDLARASTAVLRPENYLVFGQKGSGKTALASKLLLESEARYDLFIEIEELQNVDLELASNFGGTSGGAIDSGWRLLLLLRLIGLFSNDQSVHISSPNFSRFVAALQENGLLESPSIQAIVASTSKQALSGRLAAGFVELGGGHERTVSRKPKNAFNLYRTLLLSLDEVQSASTFILFLDGLDYLAADPLQLQRLATLLAAVRTLNEELHERAVHAKVVALLRDELVDRLKDPDRSKRTASAGIRLNWYNNPRSPFESDLLKIVERRANAAGLTGTSRDLWRAWFPKDILGRDSARFVLDNTRYLPRDLVSFFRELQQLAASPPFSESQVLAALRNYSDWFLGELEDAIVGLVNHALRDDLRQVFASLGREFTFDEFSAELANYGVWDASATLNAAFDTSWIGNVWRGDRGQQRYEWRYRNRKARANLRRKFVVHAGLWKTLNLV